MGRPANSAAPTCRRGHVIAETGRYANGTCIECNKLNRGRYVRKTDVPKTLLRRGGGNGPLLPWEPLRKALIASGMSPYRVASGGTIYRWQHVGIPVQSADTVCCKYLRRHPVEVYGSLWFTVDEVSA